MGGMGRQAKHHNAVIFSELDGFWFEVGAVVEDGQPRHDSRNVWSSKSGTNLDLSNHYRSLHTSFRHFILHSQVVELLCSENDVWWNRLTSCISTAYDSYLRLFARNTCIVLSFILSRQRLWGDESLRVYPSHPCCRSFLDGFSNLAHRKLPPVHVVFINGIYANTCCCVSCS